MKGNFFLCSFGLNQKNPRLSDASRAGKVQARPETPPAGQASAREQSLELVNSFCYCAEYLKSFLRVLLWTMEALSFSFTILKEVSEL